MTGRKRAPLSGDGARVEFARRLRELRDASGLSLRELADKSGYSQAALSAAESGRRVPSWVLSEAFLQGCGQNPAHWRQLWEVARDDATPSDSPAESNGLPVSAASHPASGVTHAPVDLVPHRRTRARRSPRFAWFSAGLVLGAALTYLAVLPTVSSAHSDNASATAPATGSIRVRDGADPYASGCKPDRKALDWALMSNPEGRAFGKLILYYSPACQAEWGYVTGPNSPLWVVHIVARRPGDDVSAPSSFTGTASAGSWGNLLSIHDGCVQAEAWVSDRHGSGAHAITACMQGG
jgi:DNA-binding XRE family transcriptional regulator